MNSRLASRVCLFGGSLLTVGAAVLPWVAVDGFSGRVVLSGVEAFSRISPVFSGVVTALLASIVVLLALDDRPASLAAAGIVGLLVAGVAGVYVVDPVIAYGDDPAGVLTAELTAAGVGVHLTIVAGGVVLLGAMLGAIEAADPDGEESDERSSASESDERADGEGSESDERGDGEESGGRTGPDESE